MSEVRDNILSHFQNGGTLTKISAIAPPFSTTNLGDKVFLLRKAGHDIQKRWKEVPAALTGGKPRRYAEYFMSPKATRSVLCFEGEEYELTL